MLRVIRNLPILLLISVFVFGIPRWSLAQTEGDYNTLLSQGITKLEQSDLEGAIQNFESALSKNPSGVEAIYYIGVTHARANRTKEAEENFLKALSLERTFLPAQFDLGVLYYQVRKDDQALKALALVERIDPDRARVYFYQGLILRRNEKIEEGNVKLEKAISLDPSLAAEIHFLTGAAQFQKGAFDSARKEFQGVITLTPEGELADSAREFIHQIDSQIDSVSKQQKRFRISTSFGFQYDDNVILEPRQGSVASTGISSKSDYVGILYILGKYQWLQKGDWTGDIKYSYFLNFHQGEDLTDFDIQDNHLSINAGKRFGKYAWDLEYEFQIAMLAGDTFLHMHQLSPQFVMRHSDKHITEVLIIVGSKDYQDIAVLFPTNSERDVKATQIGVNHYTTFDKKWTVYGGLSFEKEDAGDSVAEDDWTYDGFRLKAGVVLPKWREIITSFELGWVMRDYKNGNEVDTLLKRKREDDDLLLILTASRPLTEQIDLSAQYLYQQNDSNIAAFEYDRNIFGIILTVKN